MDQVPKILKPLIDEWTPDGFIVSFKVPQTDISAHINVDAINLFISSRLILLSSFRKRAAHWNVMGIISLSEMTSIDVNMRWYSFRAAITVPP